MTPLPNPSRTLAAVSALWLLTSAAAGGAQNAAPAGDPEIEHLNRTLTFDTMRSCFAAFREKFVPYTPKYSEMNDDNVATAGNVRCSQNILPPMPGRVRVNGDGWVPTSTPGYGCWIGTTTDAVKEMPIRIVTGEVQPGYVWGNLFLIRPGVANEEIRTASTARFDRYLVDGFPGAVSAVLTFYLPDLVTGTPDAAESLIEDQSVSGGWAPVQNSIALLKPFYNLPTLTQFNDALQMLHDARIACNFGPETYLRNPAEGPTALALK